MRKPLVLAAVLSVTSYVAYGQSTCAQTLRLAQSIYEQGRLHELPHLLEGCLNNTNEGFSDAEKVNAYKLLTLTYIYLEEPVKADEMMLALLRTETEFKVNDAVDPAEFVALYKTFRTYPIYRVGGKLGAIAAQPSVISADYADDGQSEYSYNFGFSATIASEIPLARKLRKFTINPELSLQVLSFNKLAEKADTARNTPATETQTWISLPVSIQYKVHENAISNVFISAGLSADYLLSSTTKIISNRRGSSPVPEDNISLQRNKFNSGLLLSAGLKRKIGKGFLIAEVRYKLGLQPMSTKQDTYANSVLVFDYKFVDGVFKMNTLSVSVGYLINRYHPKKLISIRP
jgi:hypothetical protein